MASFQSLHTKPRPARIVAMYVDNEHENTDSQRRYCVWGECHQLAI